MRTLLSILFWLSIVAYALSAGLFATALVFRQSRTLARAILAAWAGFFIHTMVVAARWVQTGHPPFVSYHETMAASAWFGVLVYLLLQQRKPFLRAAGAGLMPLIVLLMGWAGTHPIGGEGLSVTLQSFWLFVHSGFATAATGCFLMAAGVSGMRLYRQHKGGRFDDTLQIAPGDRYDEFNFRLVLLGFLLWGIMVMSGAIWADVAWGRYWGWDPVELWSLISWLVYAIYLHIYTIWKKLRGRFLAWYSIAAVFFIVTSSWGIRFLYDTIHSYGGS